MAPVNGKPFIGYLLDYFSARGIRRFVLALGYKAELIEAYAQSYVLMARTKGLEIAFSVEKEPLGTGGAIRMACEATTSEDVLILNGDTFFGISVGQLDNFHQEKNADCSLALKRMQNFSRYGLVEVDNDYSITHFMEKKFYSDGLINGGIYILKRGSLLDAALPEKFSFETDYMEKYLGKHRLFGMEQDAYFIDIGIPEDYFRAQSELQKKLG
ncbi:MAG: nucleotidyltransferase [Bacteroidetes bacterium]|nr:MAG: nucleotidyltransferase [Bacteroidota bacterium]